MEKYAIKKAIELLTDEYIRSLSDIYLELEKAFEKNDLNEYTKIDTKLHYFLFKMCDNEMIDDVVNNVFPLLQPPIYSRIDDTIQFNPLDIETINKLIRLSFEKNYSILSEEDKKLIEPEQTLKGLLELGSGVSNARIVDKFVKEYIFTRIVINRFK